MKTGVCGYAIYDEDGKWIGHVNSWEEVQRIMSQNPEYDYEIFNMEDYEELYVNKK